MNEIEKKEKRKKISNIDIYVVMEIGDIVGDLYQNKKIPFDTAYEDIVDFVEEELKKCDFYDFLHIEMSNGDDLPSTVEEWFKPRIIEYANRE